MDKLPIFEFPVEKIRIESNKHKIDDILETWVPRDSHVFKVMRDEILTAYKAEAIIALLEEYKGMHGLRMDNENMYKLAMIESDLLKLQSPIIPRSNHQEMIKFKCSRPWIDWTVWDIEREYFKIYVVRAGRPRVMPKKKYLKREVYEMLGLLLECDVIYDYKSSDLFVNDFKGELNSYFRNYKKIRVQVL